MPDSTAPPGRRRLTSLDGLRGLAALVVVLHHTLLTSAPLALAYTANTDRVTGTWTRLLAFSPLHLVWAGREAVYVFFVLSGLVLTLPVLGERARQWQTWAVYYPKRLVRLYVPVWGALVLTVVLVALRSGFDPITGASWWLNRHFVDLDARDLLDNALLTSTSWINSPLWSLHWEVVFSLVLPLVVLLAVALRRWSWLVAVVALGVAGWGGARDDHALLYLPMFVLGVLMALHLDALLRGARQLTSLAWWLLLPVVLALLSSSWWLTDLLAPVLPLVGAVLVVLAFMAWPAATRFGDLRAVQWLGTVSFSLYLVHEPVVILVAALLHGAGVEVVLLVAVPLCLAVAAVFHRLVERPSHRLANRVGRWVQHAVRPRGERATTAA